jgi:hypothetical protein
MRSTQRLVQTQANLCVLLYSEILRSNVEDTDEKSFSIQSKRLLPLTVWPTFPNAMFYVRYMCVLGEPKGELGAAKIRG